MVYSPVVVKRDGKQEEFNRHKIKSSIFVAASQVGGKDLRLAGELAEKVVEMLRTVGGEEKVAAEQIGDVVEIVLIKAGYARTAKQYILSREAHRRVSDEAKRLGVVDDIGGLGLNALTVMKAKYLRKSKHGEVIETPGQCLERVAETLARAETRYGPRKTAKVRKARVRHFSREFERVMRQLKFLPGGRTLANAGTSNNQLANCFVLPMEDGIKEIFEVVKDSSILKKNGGAVGFNFSKIRPKGDYVAGTTGKACGPVALMKILNSASDILLQDGGRRSGNMVVLNVTHPDILEFIHAKEDDTALNHINFSLGVTGKFMRAVEKGESWPLINPRNGRVVNQVKARSILELAAYMAHKNGDPGLVFLDRINRDNPTPQVGPLEAVNLCGEQPLLAYEACNLGSINLARHLRPVTRRGRRGKNEYTGLDGVKRELDWEELAKTVRVGVRMLDDAITVCRYPLRKVGQTVKANRKIGLGVMGWADTLFSLGLRYDSKEAIKLAEKVMGYIQTEAEREGQKLAEERGSFPNFTGSRWQKRGYRGMRNATLTTIAPTGSISIVAGCSYGIEPVFGLAFYKEAMGGVRLPEVNHQFKRALEAAGYGAAQQKRVIDQVSKTGSVQAVEGVSARIKQVFKTAHDLSFRDHLAMQAVFQKHTDNAVSKTINLPHTATVQDVMEAFMLAWKLGCKGTTVYRDRSRQTQVLNIGSGQARLESGEKGGGIKAMIRLRKRRVGRERLGNKCPQCGGELYQAEGCRSCPACGFAVCG